MTRLFSLFLLLLVLAAGILERVQKREAVSKAEMMNAANSKNTPEAVQRLVNRLIDRHNKL